MAPFETLYGPRYRSPIGWFESGQAKLFGTDLVKDALEKVKLIQERLHTAQSKQKSYVDQKAYALSFMVNEKVLLKVSPMKGIMRFGKKGKLSPRFIGLFEMLRYHADLPHMLDFSTIQLDESLGYEEEPVAIIDRQVRQLRSKRISAVLVISRSEWDIKTENSSVMSFKTYELSCALKRMDQDIVNVMGLIALTMQQLQTMRNSIFESLMESCLSFML
ncbi:uncharacterized protein [Nicotiana sylvestris]|uniref:uncharacterized protein n=1 Tax=Nicotiana sylvestris TaxID=4096 RepID=UPI00388C56B9